MVTQQLQNFARQSIFDALAALFLQPEAAAEAEADGTLSRYADALPAAAGLAAELGVDPRPFERAAARPMPTILELEREYARLFLGTGASTVPLTESVWTKDRNFPGARLTCRDAYADAGLETAGILGVPEDHLSLLLGFTAILILRERPKDASKFFAAHAAGWLPAFTAAIRARTDADFYRTAADVIDALCEIEKALRCND